MLALVICLDLGLANDRWWRFFLTSMATPPASPKPKRGVFGYIRDKIVRPHSRSLSQQSIEASGSGASPISPPPRTISNFLVPPPNTQTAQLRHARSDSQLPGNPNRKAETGSASVLWTGLRSAFEELREAARPFPPLGSAIESLIPCFGLLEVCFSSGL